MTYYELATLFLPMGTAPRAVAGVPAFAAEGRGELLGMWMADIGRLNRMFVLRGFEDAESLLAERKRTHESASPFGCGDVLADLSLESYEPFPFMKPVRPGSYGGVYEFRTYPFRIGGGYPETAAKWEEALPAREKFSQCLIAMRALDGTPRFLNIWPYADIAARGKARAESVAAGVWPPKGGPDWLKSDMESVVAVPAAGSPLS